MTGPDAVLRAEQSLVTALYERLDALRRRTERRLTEVRRAGSTGTPQARSERDAFSVVRITTGKDNTVEEIDGFLKAFETAVAQLRELSPLYAG